MPRAGDGCPVEQETKALAEFLHCLRRDRFPRRTQFQQVVEQPGGRGERNFAIGLSARIFRSNRLYFRPVFSDHSLQGVEFRRDLPRFRYRRIEIVGRRIRLVGISRHLIGSSHETEIGSAAGHVDVDAAAGAENIIQLRRILLRAALDDLRVPPAGEPRTPEFPTERRIIRAEFFPELEHLHAVDAEIQRKR